MERTNCTLGHSTEFTCSECIEKRTGERKMTNTKQTNNIEIKKVIIISNDNKHFSIFEIGKYNKPYMTLKTLKMAREYINSTNKLNFNYKLKLVKEILENE